jgi:anti-sigma B factor antagonist
LEERTRIDFATRIIKGAQGIPIVEVEGEVDLSTSPELKQVIYDIIESGRNTIVLDLSNVLFMDSTGLGILVAALKKARMQGGTVKLICSNPMILKTFRITGLDKVFLIYDNLRECLGD